MLAVTVLVFVLAAMWALRVVLSDKGSRRVE